MGVNLSEYLVCMHAVAHKVPRFKGSNKNPMGFGMHVVRKRMLLEKDQQIEDCPDLCAKLACTAVK